MRADSGAPPDRAYARVVVVALAGVYLLNFLDRQLLAVLAEPIKRDLGLSDTQLGLLTGLTFALFYTVFGIPIAALADRVSRVRIIAGACALWSLFTVATGLSGGFAALAAARVGVGVGEAGGSPASCSLIADYFPPERRGGALAGYSLGVPLGALFGISAGSWIASVAGWRTAFIALGLVGVAAAPLLLAVVREVPRAPRAPDDLARPSLRSAATYFVRSPTLMLNALAAGLMAFVGYGVMNWAPAYLMRVQHMTLAEFGISYGLVSAVGIGLGIWTGGVIANRTAGERPFRYALLPGLGMLVVPLFLWGLAYAQSWQAALPLLFGTLFLGGTYLATALAVVQNRAPAAYRATSSAILLFVLNLIGIGGGPLYVGLLSDRLRPDFGPQALGYALLGLAPMAVFACLAQAAMAASLSRAPVHG